MAYTSYKQFAPSGYEFIDDKTGQSVVASGPEAILHARKIDSIYAPVDPMMRQAADSMQDDRLAMGIDGIGARGWNTPYVDAAKAALGLKSDTSSAEPLPLVPNYGQVDAPPPMIAREPEADVSAKDLPPTLPQKRSAIDKRYEAQLEEKAGVAKKEAKSPTAKPPTAKPRLQDPNDWNMDQAGAPFLSDPTTPEAIAEKAYIANEIAAAQSPTPPGPIEKLGPAVPVSRSAAVGPGLGTVSDAMAAQEALAKANAAVEGRALDRQDYVDNELFNIAEITKESTDAQIKTLEEERRNREKADSAIKQAMAELDVINNPNSAFNNPTAGDRIMGVLYIALTAVGAAAGGRDVAKAVAEEMDRDGRARGKVDKKLESILKANGILNENVDKKKVIDASKGLLQTQAILSKIDALKAINMSELQRDRLTLVEKEQLANQAMYIRDLETQTNGTVNYALAGGMKPKGGGGSGGDKALENLLKYQGGKLANTYGVGGKYYETPNLSEGAAAGLRKQVNGLNRARNALRKLKEMKANGVGVDARNPLSENGGTVRRMAGDIEKALDAAGEQGQTNESVLKSANEAVTTHGLDSLIKIYEASINLAESNVVESLTGYGAREVERLWLKKRTDCMTKAGKPIVSHQALSKMQLEARTSRQTLLPQSR